MYYKTRVFGVAQTPASVLLRRLESHWLILIAKSYLPFDISPEIIKVR